MDMNNYQYAGFLLRFVAVLIDSFLFLIVIAAPLSVIYGVEYWEGTQLVHGFWDVVLNYVFPLVVTVWFWQRFLGTPGKMAFKLRVVDAKSGAKLTVPQSIGRYFAYILSALPLCLGFIWIAFDSRKQGWHDKLAGSVVIRDTAETPVEFEESA